MHPSSFMTALPSWLFRGRLWLGAVVLLTVGGCVDLTVPWANQVRDASTVPQAPDTAPGPRADDAATGVDEDARPADRQADAASVGDGGPEVEVAVPYGEAGSGAVDGAVSDGLFDAAPRRDLAGLDAEPADLVDAAPGSDRADTPQLRLPDACAACDGPTDKPQDNPQDESQDEPRPDLASPDVIDRDGASDASNLSVGLVGHWTFDEGAGSIVNDSSGNGISGSLLKAPVWSTDCAPSRGPGTNLACLHFDGTSQSVLMDDAAAANFSGAISLSAWVKTDAPRSSTTSSAVFRNIVVKGFTNDPWAEVSLRLQNNAYTVGSFDGLDHQVLSDTGLADVGVWVHLAGVYDGTTWSLYRNGVLEESARHTVGALQVRQPWSIGASSSGTDRFFNGFIDDVRIYRRALSSGEVAVLAAGI
jgi:hypothetical protein